MRTMGKWLLRGGAAVVVAVMSVMIWAVMTEPGPLVGAARDEDPDVQAYAAAEKRLIEHFGVEAREHSVTLSDPALRLHVLEVPGEGTPVVVVHGGGSMLAGWLPLVPHLKGRHLFLVDRPGCGLSDGFDYVDVDLRRHAVDVIAGVLDDPVAVAALVRPFLERQAVATRDE